MKQINYVLIIALLAVGTIVGAQNSTNKNYIFLGTHAVDYAGAVSLKQAIDIENWKLQTPISRIAYSRYLSPSFAADIAGSVGSVSNPRMGMNKQFFVNAGVGLRYKFTNGYMLKENCWFDPYLRVGANYHYYDYSTGSISNSTYDHGYSTIKNMPNVAAGAGFNIWFTSKFGLNFQSDYNFAFKPRHYQDFIQNSVGVVFRFGGKDSDKDGVPDDKDKCPDVAGLKKFDGCPDTDGDGVIDSEDQCPTVAGEFNGCPDTDKDGLHDGIDKCPTVAGPKENNGCPWADQDNDGVPDKDDKCPTVAGTFDGCPDTDKDGVPDNLDQCPTVPGTVNGCPDADKDGVADKDDKCPNAAGPASNQGCPQLEKKDKEALVEQSKNIYFVSGSAKLTNNSKTVLNDIAVMMKKYPEAKFNIEGYTDNTGSDALNLRLSNDRAEAVKDYLLSRGLSNTITAKGYGESNPVASNSTAIGRTQNRRVVINLGR